MAKNYKNSFKQIKNFLENDTMTSEPKAMYFINSATLSLLNTAKSISEDKDIPIEDVMTPDLLKNYFDLSTSISTSLNSAFDNYVKLTVNSYDLSNKEKENTKKEIQQSLASFLVTLKSFFDSCGALEHLKIQHDVRMRSLNLSKLAVTPEQIDAEFDYRRNSITPLPTLITKSAFWANKAVKYIENLKVSILLFEKNSLSYTKENYDNLTDKDKITAIYKEEILTRFRNNIARQLPDDFSFNALLVLYSSVLEQQLNMEKSVMTPELEDLLQKLPDLDVDSLNSLFTQMLEFHEQYDKTFAPKQQHSEFTSDIYSIGNNFSLEDDLYNYKSTLMVMLGMELLQQKQLAAPHITHFGNSSDRDLTVFSVDLPNYFMPASFHYEKDATDSDKLGNFIKQLPNYNGFFKNSNSHDSVSTHILFNASAEQKKYIKDEYKKAKAHPDSYRTKILSQMNAMANGQWREFDTLINKQQQH